MKSVPCGRRWPASNNMKIQSQKGFTLVEITVASSISVVIGAAVLTFFIQGLRFNYSSQQQIKQLGTMRVLTNELIRNATRCHEFVMYDSTTAADRDNVADRKQIEIDGFGDEIHPTGNFVVFINYELPKPAAQNKYRVASIVGYYPQSTSDGAQELVKMTITLSTPSANSLETILQDNWATATRRVIANRIQPLALSTSTSTTPQVFYMRSRNNLAVCGQILESNVGTNTKNIYTHTRTFYFTLTVRS